jgi:hypothetical protein
LNEIEWVRLWHGTTFKRASSILAQGPSRTWCEPGEDRRHDPAFWAVDATQPQREQALGTADEYARRKALAFPNESGPAIVEFAISRELYEKFMEDFLFDSIALSGAICFDDECGLADLSQLWASLPKVVITLGTKEPS